MEINFIIIVGIIFFIVIIFGIIKTTTNQVELIKKEKHLLQIYKNTLKKYNDNLQKYEKYREEILEWQNKIEDARDEYYIKSLEDSYSSDMKILGEQSLERLISLLEQFQKWKIGKIE